ncbi:MAG: glutamine amidotransferase [Bryobacteraceae bacterium]
MAELSRNSKKFQLSFTVREALERIEKADGLKGSAPATRLGDALKQVVSEASSLPIGAVVLLTDGGDNSGGIDLATMSEVRRYRIPVHTVGFGREKLLRDIELVEAELPARALAESRLAAQVTLRQFGYESRKARITLRDGNKILVSREVTLKADGNDQMETVTFSAGPAAAKAVQVAVEPLDGEENRSNNVLSRLINVEASKPRILYIEGEPKWEYKFIRRSIELDHGLELVSMLRTTQNKIYRQGVKNPSDLQEGFPATVDELFSYQGLIIGGLEANYFTTTQQELLRQFVDRRGGGILFLGGRGGLTDGGWAQSAMADLLPVLLPNRKDGFRRDPANVELTAAGRDSLLCRLEDNPDRNVERWKKLPYLQGYQDVGSPKPGAVVLAEIMANGRRFPLLAAQNFGRGRTVVFATSGSWRWQMTQPVEDLSHEVFWQQLLRWVVSGTNGRVILSTPRSVYSDETRVPLR